MLKKKTEKNDEKVKKNLKNVKFQKCENTGAENGNFGNGPMPAIFKTGIPRTAGVILKLRASIEFIFLVQNII